MSIAGIDPTTPSSTANAGGGDDQIRDLKTAIRACFSGIAGLVKKGVAGPAASHVDISALFDRLDVIEATLNNGLTNAGLVIGEIRAYVGDIADLPLGWVVCDFSQPFVGIPNLEGLYLIGANAAQPGGGPLYDDGVNGPQNVGGFKTAALGGLDNPAWHAVWYIEYVGYNYDDTWP